MENICSTGYFPASIYRFKSKLAKSRFDDITYVCVNSVFCSMVLILIFACVIFSANILLRFTKNTYLLLHLFIKSFLPRTHARTLLFYFNYKPLFLLPNNTFYPITLFYVPWGSIILLLYCI